MPDDGYYCTYCTVYFQTIDIVIDYLKEKKHFITVLIRLRRNNNDYAETICLLTKTLLTISALHGVSLKQSVSRTRQI